MKKPAKAARGLTLIELMVALGILAVLMSLAVPSFGQIMQRQRLKAAAEDLAMDLSEARFQATRRGAIVSVQFSGGPDWCWALALADGCDCRVPQGCQLKTVHAADHPGVRLQDSRDARFEPQGGRVDSQLSSEGHATLQSADGARLRVKMGLLGRASVCVPLASVPGTDAC